MEKEPPGLEKKEPVLVTKNVTSEEESPEIGCVTCLLTGHQGGKECHLPQEKCMNCGYSHNWMVTCMEVRLTLKYGGDPMSHARPRINEETPMEDLCMNCLELRHHSCLPCKKKETKRAVPSQETPNTPDHSPQLAVPMPMEKTLAEETPRPLIESSNPQESPKLSYRDALMTEPAQGQETLNTPDYSPQLVVLMPKGKTLAKETISPACGRSSPKESPKGSWIKRMRNYYHGVRNKEPP